MDLRQSNQDSQWWGEHLKRVVYADDRPYIDVTFGAGMIEASSVAVYQAYGRLRLVSKLRHLSHAVDA